MRNSLLPRDRGLREGSRTTAFRATAALVVALVAPVVAAVLVSCAPATAPDSPPPDASSSNTGTPGSALSGTSVAQPTPPPTSSAEVPVLQARIIAQHPMPDAPFVQGLEFESDGSLLLGTGLYGTSQIYRFPQWLANPDTARPEAIQDLRPELFGEGITRVGDTVWQLTWREHQAIARDGDSLVEKHSVPLEREGWGLCNFGDSLVLSDGTGTLSLRDPATFGETAQLPVTLAGAETTWLNELECVETAEGREVWANVWQTNTIFRIDPRTGAVTGTVDATNLYEALPEAVRGSVDVLNGIAKIPDSDRYLLTGKKWPVAFEVQFTG